MDFIKKNAQYIGFTGCVFMILGNFLPFAKVTVDIFGFSQSQSIKFIDGDGLYVLIAAIAALVLIYLKKYRFALIPTGISAAIAIYDMVDVSSVVGETMGIGKISFGVGSWTIILGSILTIICVILEAIKSKKDE